MPCKSINVNYFYFWDNEFIKRVPQFNALNYLHVGLKSPFLFRAKE